MPIRVTNELSRQFLAEFLGTFTFVFLLESAVAQKVLYGEFSWLGVAVAGGFSLSISIFLAAPVSGAHINPAVTIAQAITHQIRGKAAFVFIIAQMMGSFVAGAAVYMEFYVLISQEAAKNSTIINPLSDTTWQIFSCNPSPSLTIGAAFFQEFLGAMILVLVVYACIDTKHRLISTRRPAPTLMIGATLTALILAMGKQTGASFNPARDLGSRMFSYLIYGKHVFYFPNDHAFYPYETKPTQFWWIQIFAPLVGALAGAFMYQSFIGSHWPNDPEVTPLLDSRPPTPLEKRRKKPVNVFLKRSDSSITSIGEISWNGIP